MVNGRMLFLVDVPIVRVNDPSCILCPWCDVPLVLQDRERDLVLQISKLKRHLRIDDRQDVAYGAMLVLNW